MGAARSYLIVADDRLSTAMVALNGESGVPARRTGETPVPPSLSRRFFLVFALLLFFFRPVSGEGQERCGVGKDYMVQALEQIKTGSREEVENGLQLLKHANEQCTSLGDAWYYRSLFERKLGHTPLADYSLKKAQMFGSDAWNEKSDPFKLAAPLDLKE